MKQTMRLRQALTKQEVLCGRHTADYAPKGDVDMSNAEKGELMREQIIEAINSYINLHQYPPTIREVCEMVGLKSPASVYRHVEILKEQGVLESDGGKQNKRALRVRRRTEDFDALFLAKCKEVNELQAQIKELQARLQERGIAWEV
jgi:SOS-response transcriptional repressor LexA